jgi:Zn-dependent protease with chaperone function
LSTSLSLLMVFFLAGYVAPSVLGRARWPYRSPRLGVAAWLTVAGICALTAVFAVGTVAIPVAVAGHGLADWWHACLGEWGHYYGDASIIVIAAAAVIAVIMLGRLLHSSVSYRRSTVGIRRAQQAGLSLVGFEGPRNVVVLPHPVPAAYCVPGRPGHVVMTDSAIRALEPDQVDAVVAHERAHLAGRHSMLVGVATVLQGAFGRIAPVFGRATRESAALVEMIADDAAVAMCPAARVAEALLRLADGAAPRATFAAGGSDMVRRIRRLSTPPRPLGPVPRLATLVALCLGPVAPVATVVGPVVAGVVASTCAHPTHG